MASTPQDEATSSAPPSQIISVATTPWEDFMPGVRSKPLWADEGQQRRAMLGRLDAGVSLDPHRHHGDELVYVIEGAMSDEAGTLSAGQIGYRPDGCEHTIASEFGATVLAFISGSTTPIDETGDGPISEIIDPVDLTWDEVRPGMLAKTVWTDPGGGARRLMLFRFAEGATIDLHRHAGDELVFVLEGTVEDDFGVVRPGNLGYRPNGCVHTVSAPGGATALALIHGHTEPL